MTSEPKWAKMVIDSQAFSQDLKSQHPKLSIRPDSALIGGSEENVRRISTDLCECKGIVRSPNLLKTTFNAVILILDAHLT